MNTLDAAALERIPLPLPAEGSKEDRGRICIIGGSREVPGAVLLAATSALRAGAGKLQILTVESRAGELALAMPEALVIGLPETPAGGLQAGSVESASARWAASHALLVGPGMVEEPASHDVLVSILDHVDDAVIVADAGALPRITELEARLRSRQGRVIVTPHAGEMANLLGVDKEVVEADPGAAARRLTDDLGLVVVMKGSETIVTAPGGDWIYRGGSVGLATSGSGDVLAGIIAGLAARGADPVVSALWGVYLHGEAGSRLARRVGTLGFLAREIASLVPALMDDPGGSSRK